MTPDRWHQIEELYHRAAALPESHRAEFLNKQCEGDRALREAVERLLAAADGPLESFLEQPALNRAAQQIAEDSESWIGRRIRSYQFISLIGAGGMGEVYRVRDTALQRDVAVKVLPRSVASDRRRISRMEQEARALAAVNHPNIAAIYSLEETDNRYALVLELVDGNTLRDHLSNGPIPLSEALRIARQIAEALEAAHSKSIIHRDLKPENIKITPEGTVKVLDFGLAKVFETADRTDLSEMPTVTETGIILGTPAYMSPEQARGTTVNKQSDIWAFGCVLFEMLTGSTAFKGNTASDTIASILEREPQLDKLPEQTPARIRELLRRCLEKDTRYRLHDIADARIEIDNADVNLHTPDQPRTSNWRHVRLKVGASIAAAVLIGLLLWVIRPAVPDVEGASVVALPAQVLGAQDLTFLTDAIPNTLSTQLGQVDGLETKVPPTSIEFETIHRDLRKIADVYGVKTCIISSITATDANHFVLNVELVDPRSGQILWGQQYEGQLGSYLELARQAASGIREKLKPSTSSIITATGQPNSSEAELAFREGKYFSNRYNNLHQIENFDKAIAAFQRALVADPKLASAAAEIAFLHRFKWEGTRPASREEGIAINQRAIADIELWANRALALDPHCGRAWSALVWAEYVRFPINQTKVLESSLKAVAFSEGGDPISHVSLGATLQLIANELSLPAYMEARRIDPLYVYSYLNAAGSLFALHRYDEALAIAEDGARIEPEFGGVLNSKYLALQLLGRKGEALAFLGQHPKLSNDPGTRYIATVESGDTQRIRPLREGLVGVYKDPQVPSNARQFTSIRMIPYLIQNGQRDIAMQLLNGMTSIGDLPSYSWLMLNPIFEPFRGDRSFQDVVSHARMPFIETLKSLQESQNRGELPKYLEVPLAELIRKLGTP